METKTKVFYSDFGAVGDGVTEDFHAIKAAHDYANEHGLMVRGNKNATYYISDTRISGKVSQIVIKTNTDWQGAKIIIDDTNIASNDGTKQHSKNVFLIASDYENVTKTIGNEIVDYLDSLAVSGNLGPDTKKLDISLGYPAMIFINNSSRRVYIRYGSNANDGNEQTELVLIDKYGNIDPNTALLLDYTDVTSIEIIRTDVTPITVKKVPVRT